MASNTFTSSRTVARTPQRGCKRTDPRPATPRRSRSPERGKKETTKCDKHPQIKCGIIHEVTSHAMFGASCVSNAL